jgi:ATP-dependent RNA helicase DDX24/MAK5
VQALLHASFCFVQDVRCVIHYQIPASPDVYVHRCGRTARAEKDGVSIALVGPTDSIRFASLFKAFERQMPEAFPVDIRLLPKLHKRVRVAVRCVWQKIKHVPYLCYRVQQL